MYNVCTICLNYQRSTRQCCFWCAKHLPLYTVLAKTYCFFDPVVRWWMAVIFVNSLPISLLNAATGVATHNNIIKQLHCSYQLDIDCILLAQALGLLYHINFTLFIYIPSFTTVPISGTQTYQRCVGHIWNKWSLHGARCYIIITT